MSTSENAEWITSFVGYVEWVREKGCEEWEYCDEVE